MQQQSPIVTGVIAVSIIASIASFVLISVSNTINDNAPPTALKIQSIETTIGATTDEKNVLNAVLNNQYPTCDVSVVTVQYCQRQYISLLAKMGDAVTLAEASDPVASNLYNRIKIRAKQY